MFSSFLGARYVRFDEDFMLRSDYEQYDYSGVPTYGSSGYLSYNCETDNQLVGFQLGCNGCYHLGCCGDLLCTAPRSAVSMATFANESVVHCVAGTPYDDGTNTRTM